MDAQNVSAQLYFKQMPEDKSAASYNCQDTFPNLSTCVGNTKSDMEIENAFQQQLDLSEYYKSPLVFESVKKEFMEPTIEYENKPVNEYVRKLPDPPSIPVNIPVGPEDFLKKNIKEGFGKKEINIAVVALLLAILFFSIYKQWI